MAPQTLDSRVRLWLTPNGDLTDNGESAKTADNAGEASWYDRYRLIVAAGDVGAAFAAVFASHALRFGFQGSFRAEHWLVPLAIALTWVAALQVVDSRSKRVVGMGLEEYRRVLEASLFAFGAVAVVSYLVRAQPSRSYFVLALPVGVVLLLSWRWLARSVLSNARRHGRFLTPAVIVGSRRAVARAVHELTRRPEGGIRPVAVCLPRSAKSLEDFPAELERVDRGHVPEIVEARHLGAVVICDGLTAEATTRLAWSLERHDVDLLFSSELLDLAGPRVEIRTLGGFDLAYVGPPQFQGWRLRAKRLFDITVAITALAALLPLLVIIALVIWLEDHRSPLFRQQRIGLYGAPFVILKFRTMGVNAEAGLTELQQQSTSNHVLFKMPDDPRITRTGRVLRRFSLDELLQFWNVLRGDMSVVGPRPHLAPELEQFPDAGLRRLLIKPGITGLWQISGRSELSMEDSIRLDLRYVENWSLMGDVVIILKTVKAVVTPEGAY